MGGRESCNVPDETEDQMITGDTIRKKEGGEPAEQADLVLTEGYRILPEETVFPDGGIIACQGVRGANSQLAATALFGGHVPVRRAADRKQHVRVGQECLPDFGQTGGFDRPFHAAENHTCSSDEEGRKTGHDQEGHFP